MCAYVWYGYEGQSGACACGTRVWLLSWYMRARLGVGLDGRLLLGDGCCQWKPNKIERLLPKTDCTPVCACVRCGCGCECVGCAVRARAEGDRKAVACTATRTQGYARDCRCVHGGGMGRCLGVVVVQLLFYNNILN